MVKIRPTKSNFENIKVKSTRLYSPNVSLLEIKQLKAKENA